jgi:CheY-like chemotaxis protein
MFLEYTSESTTYFDLFIFLCTLHQQRNVMYLIYISLVPHSTYISLFFVMSEKKVVYLADDDADDREFFQDALSEIALQTELVIAEDGVVLMRTLEEKVPPPPHVIFLDLNMPRKNGYECLLDIRSTDRYKDIPVVIFSTTANPDVIAKTQSLGANLYLRKPTSIEMLKKMIHHVLTLDLSIMGMPSSNEGFYLRMF